MLGSFTIAQKSIINSAMRILADNGITSLGDAMEKVGDELSRDHEMRKADMLSSDKYCPECGNMMQPLRTDGLLQMLCKKCRYSEIVEG